MASRVLLALGTNLGRRQVNLQQAVNSLGTVAAIEAVSAVYETAPWGVEDQPYFLNNCVAAQTLLSPQRLLEACKTIERDIGREPGERWGPRLIDIDILYYEDTIIDETNLRIPHPHLEERAFVLVPLADIAADFHDPRSGRTISELKDRLHPHSVAEVRRLPVRLARPKTLAWGVKTYIMGIVNATPDSFSGDGLITTDDWLTEAVDLAERHVQAGADILDVGAESTRPGSIPISPETEQERLLPALQAIRRAVDVPISVDTYRASVAEAALEAGADWINDVWGLRLDADMAGLVARSECPIIIMHNRSKPKNVDQEERLGGRYVGSKYKNLIEDVRRELQDSIDLALNAGVQISRIIIDPGIGFGKTVSQNARLLNELDKIKAMGFPLLVGPSRKSFIGYTLDLPPNDRLEGTAATVTIAIDRGADVIRVHDVQAMSRVARMTDTVIRQPI